MKIGPRIGISFIIWFSSSTILFLAAAISNFNYSVVVTALLVSLTPIAIICIFSLLYIMIAWFMVAAFGKKPEDRFSHLLFWTAIISNSLFISAISDTHFGLNDSEGTARTIIIISIMIGCGVLLHRGEELEKSIKTRVLLFCFFAFLLFCFYNFRTVITYRYKEKYSGNGRICKLRYCKFLFIYRRNNQYTNMLHEV